MKRIVSLLSAVVLLTAWTISLTACSNKWDGVVNVYNWGEYISNGSDGLMNVRKEFEKRYNIKVNYKTFSSNEEMYAKISGGSANYDVLIPSDYMITRMIENDMLHPLNFENIPNYKYIDDDYKGGAFGYDPENKYSIPYTWGMVGIAYNSKNVTEPVDSWDVLWNEAYKGKIYMLLNARDSFGIAQKKLGISLNTDSKEEIQQAADELKKQRPLIAGYVMDEMMDKMIGEEVWLTPCYAGDGVTMMDENEDIEVAFPKEGSNVFVDAMVIPKDAKNIENAEKFINFMNDPDVAYANIMAIQYSSPHTEAYKMLPEEIKNNEVIYPPKDVLDKAEIFKHLPEDIIQFMDELWTDIKNNS